MKFIEAVPAVDDIMGDFEATVERQRHEYVEAMECIGILRGIQSLEPVPAPAVPDHLDDELLTIAAASKLPELGGIVSSKRLYGEVSAGRLRLAANSGPGKFFVTRKLIKEWIEWRDQESRPISSGSNPNSLRTGNYGRTDTGRSQTEKSALARDTALSIVQKLRQSGSSMK
ncbi:hypothetical protein [Sinorhizobium meliloti]|uniref:hypothetical protein n=1 Tax=Rhizobium meliloti TaxID=382 RepID=UPI000FE024EE|nr:hypothetical protein [Sinorhizobium meliloti]RVG70865.1 hypothetical protein CN222_01645 [Sinorhizobium meliloti]